MISKEKKAEIIANYGRKAGDTGSPEVQVAILTERIAELTEHLKVNQKDHQQQKIKRYTFLSEKEHSQKRQYSLKLN